MRREIHMFDYSICLFVSQIVRIFRELKWIHGEVAHLDIELHKHEIFPDFFSDNNDIRRMRGERREIITVIGTNPQIIIAARFLGGSESLPWKSADCSFAFAGLDKRKIECPVEGVEFKWDGVLSPHFESLGNSDAVKAVLYLAKRIFDDPVAT